MAVCRWRCASDGVSIAVCQWRCGRAATGLVGWPLREDTTGRRTDVRPGSMVAPRTGTGRRRWSLVLARSNAPDAHRRVPDGSVRCVRPARRTGPSHRRPRRETRGWPYTGCASFRLPMHPRFEPYTDAVGRRARLVPGHRWVRTAPVGQGARKYPGSRRPSHGRRPQATILPEASGAARPERPYITRTNVHGSADT